LLRTAHAALRAEPTEKAAWLRACALGAPLHPLCAESRRDLGSRKLQGHGDQASRIRPPNRWASREPGMDRQRAGIKVARVRLRTLSFPFVLTKNIDPDYTSRNWAGIG